ncbi:histidine phosphatase family protein [Paracoccus sediminicola]|uniref:histidine phosphatase family protein n=1 Tax=Paracoccus sediminicola TaxID=3017783 RepID=UPI0022EFF823|nr:histidine phosphatase family protein [Paracoccus sediminicola]WBU56169.1 histidine phosphatase family protein [Paracoccus sediminicola]
MELARQSRYVPPRDAAVLLLVRHGESMPAIRDQSFQLRDGQGDPELHPDGKAQARLVCARLLREGVDAVVVSTLTRTQQTAAPLLEATGLKPVIEADLREVHLGEWEGGAYRFHAAEGHPAIRRARDLGEWGEIPGAETTAELHRRVRASLIRTAQAHPDQRVACFVHGGVIGAALSLATGAAPFAFNGAANGSISELVVKGQHMQVRRFNDCAHL